MSYPESYEEKKNAAWRYFIGDIRQPWTSFQADCKSLIPLMRSTKKPVIGKVSKQVKKYQEQYIKAVTIRYQKYLKELSNAWIEECYRNAKAITK